MSQSIIDGTGTQYAAKVDQNHQLHSFCTSQTVAEDAIFKGDGYNINTGWINLTSTTASAVLYFKNDEPPINGESAIYVESIIVATDGLGTVASGAMTDIVVYANPTGGTIISGASAVAYNANRNFGSNNTLATTTLAYKGAEGNTLTGGTSFALLGQPIATRATYPLGVYLTKGASIGITVDTQTTAGTTQCYVAMIIHRVDGKNK